MNKLQEFENKQSETLVEGKAIPDFQAGDTIRVNVRIIEGTTERIQAFEGVCIARKNRGLNSSFTVRKISHGEGVERIFPLYSPRIESIKIVRKGEVRRAKLYYMRGLTGKAARIKEKRDFLAAAEEQVETAAAAPAPKPEAKEEPAKEEKQAKPEIKEEKLAEEKKEAKPAEAKEEAPKAEAKDAKDAGDNEEKKEE